MNDTRKRIAVFAFGHDGYANIWPDWWRHWKAAWPKENDWPLYFASEHLPITDVAPDCTGRVIPVLTHSAPEDCCASQRSALEQIDADIVLAVMHQDFIIGPPIDNAKLRSAAELFQRHNMDWVSVIDRGSKWPNETDYGESTGDGLFILSRRLHMCTPGSDQPGLWRRELMLECTPDTGNPWRAERGRCSNLAETKFRAGWVEDFVFRNQRNMWDAVRRGKWRKNTWKHLFSVDGDGPGPAEKPVEEKTPIVFVLGKGSKWQDNELRYALRSVDKYAARWIHPVIVVGEKPEWVSDEVVHVPADDVYTHCKDANLIHKLKEALRSGHITGKFIHASDDQFLARRADPEDVSPRYLRIWNPAADEWCDATKWHKHLRDTLARFGANSKYFQPHAWSLMDKDVFERMLNDIDWMNSKSIIIKSLYYNYAAEAGIKEGDRHKFLGPCSTLESVEKQTDSATMVAYTDKTITPAFRTWLDNKFPEPSRYEKDKWRDAVPKITQPPTQAQPNHYENIIISGRLEYCRAKLASLPFEGAVPIPAIELRAMLSSVLKAKKADMDEIMLWSAVIGGNVARQLQPQHPVSAPNPNRHPKPRVKGPVAAPQTPRPNDVIWKDTRQKILDHPSDNGGHWDALKETLASHERAIELKGDTLGACWVKQQWKRVVDAYIVVIKKEKNSK